jgi:hypothetical protein
VNFAGTWGNVGQHIDAGDPETSAFQSWIYRSTPSWTGATLNFP